MDDFSGFYPLPELAREPNVICLMPESGAAYFMFIPHRPMLWEVHAAVLPEARGQSVEYGKAAARWMRANTFCRTILSYVPRGNYPALALDRAIGFKKVGVVPACNPLKGKLQAMTLMALSME